MRSFFQITDEKTATSLGVLTYNLSNLMEKKNLEDKQQPFNLQDAPPESKVVLSMTLRVRITQFHENIFYFTSTDQWLFSLHIDSQI